VITREFRVIGSPDVDVDVRSATVVIDRGGPGIVTVSIEGKNADDWEVAQSGDTISVRDEHSGWRSRGGAKVRVSTPDGAAVRVKTASGDVTVGVATGRTQISTASGDIRVAIAEALAVSTASGDVSIDRVTTDVAVKSASGDLTATAIGGGLEASTASGDVRVSVVAGDVRVNTASGDVRIARFEGAVFSANTVSGDVTLGVPAGRAACLDVKTLSGDVVLPERRATHDDPAAPRPTVDIRVKSVSGDFRLQRA
jgi:DUF4097 and DUF4098 domain-containing protein YvlB